MKQTLLDLYTREEIRDLRESYCEYQYDYCPIVCTYEENFPPICYKKRDYFKISLFKEYLTRLLEAALIKTQKEYPDFLKMDWIKNNGYFYELTPLCDKYDAARHSLWDNLRLIADAKEVTVHEKKFRHHKFDFILSPENIKKIDTVTKLRKHEYDKTPYSWKWEEVKQYYKELSLKEMTFFHGEQMNYLGGNTGNLFWACELFDSKGIRNAVENGADVNGFDEFGDTPIVCLLSHFHETEENKVDELIETMKFLLDNGADINLFGFGGHDIISEAHYLDNIKIMKFIFDNGVRNDLNCWIFEKNGGSSWYIKCWAYDDCITDINLGEDENRGYHYKEQVYIMEKHGMTLYIDGWDGDKLSDYYGWDN
ncbi:MAG: hypothetical protein IK024_06430 [Treponema sp.]|nr:hypothetical protein [Treponema sp.]